MSAPVVALLGAALFERRVPEPDPAALATLLGLLARATEGAPQLIEIARGRLLVNGVEMSLSAPGAAVIADALVDHDTARLQLPAEMGPKHWREVVDVYAAPFAHFPTALDVQKALRMSLPATDVGGIAEANLTDAGLRGPRAAAPRPLDDAPTTRGGDLSAFSGELSQLQKDGSRAVRERDAMGVARVLLLMHAMADGHTGQLAIVALERRRTVDSITLSWLIDEAASPTTPGQLTEALRTFGSELVEPAVRAIGHRSNPGERANLMELLAPVPGVDMAIVDLLRGNDTTVLRGAAEMAGHLRINAAVFPLAALLRHQEEGVRTRVWHALESIGTPEAFDALNAPSF